MIVCVCVRACAHVCACTLTCRERENEGEDYETIKFNICRIWVEVILEFFVLFLKFFCKDDIMLKENQTKDSPKCTHCHTKY